VNERRAEGKNPEDDDRDRDADEAKLPYNNGGGNFGEDEGEIAE
jgi:hypothetical protein